jgi:alkanesulfonate monooxygenase SsuD/methylene tetrahydromethanopterin reductase-like flavin-dependent oxidoreductase (luciferase family)
MKLGLHINDFSWPIGADQFGPTLTRIAQAAEAGGFDRISIGDHVWQSPYLGGPEREVLACYPTLAYLCGQTSRIKLLALVTAAPYWQPVLLAKSVTTLDVLSGGRAWLGIGVGDYEEEARGSGLPFPPLQERYQRLEEMLQICRVSAILKEDASKVRERASLKKNLSLFMHPPRHLAETLLV